MNPESRNIVDYSQNNFMQNVNNWYISSAIYARQNLPNLNTAETKLQRDRRDKWNTNNQIEINDCFS